MSLKYISDSYHDFSIYTAQSRGIPNVTDGLKHSQRIGMWVLRNKTEKAITAGVSGEMLASLLYDHGDAAAADCLSTMASPWQNNRPLLKGYGIFGTRLAPVEGIGSPRYTKIMKSKAADAFLYVDMDIIEMQDNVSGNAQEPVTFLPLLPTVLINGCKGMSVGFSTDIYSRNFNELLETTIEILNGGLPSCELLPYWDGYNVITIPTEKPNQYLISGRLEIIDSSTIHITELPRFMKIESFRSKLIDMEEKDIIATYIDRSTESIDISIKLKRGMAKDWSVDDALDFFKLREKITERIEVIGWDRKSILSYDNPFDLIKDFVQWRLSFYTKRYEKLLTDASDELIYWSSLKALYVGDFTKKLGKFANKATMRETIVEIASGDHLEPTDAHLERIMNIATYRWTTEFENEIDQKIIDICANIGEYEDILGSPDKLKAVYRDELENLKKIKF